MSVFFATISEANISTECFSFECWKQLALFSSVGSGVSFKNFKQTYLNHKQHYFYVESQECLTIIILKPTSFDQRLSNGWGKTRDYTYLSKTESPSALAFAPCTFVLLVCFNIVVILLLPVIILIYLKSIK